MSGLLAVSGLIEEVAWAQMVADVSELGAARREEWRDDEEAVRLVRASRSALEPTIVTAHGCVVMLDGTLDDFDDRGAADAVAAAYRRWGSACVGRLRGEFAFVLWDRLERTLFAACDVASGRTLAYSEIGDMLAVSSRAVALLRPTRAKRRFDRTYLAHSICDWWGQPPGATAFEGIHRLRPGFGLLWRSRKAELLRCDRLQLAPAPSTRASKRRIIDEFWNVLDATVSTRSRRLVRPSIALSGGLDSPCVATSVLRCVPSLHAFSLVDGPSTDERHAIQQLVTRYAQLEWHPIDCSADVALSEPWGEFPLRDDPGVNPSSFQPARIHLWKEIARRGFSSVIDGEGGDEVFDLGARATDLLNQRAWFAMLRAACTSRYLRSTIVREWIAPLLRGPLRAAWIRREGVLRHPFPTWTTQAFVGSRATRDAVAEAESVLIVRPFEERLPLVLELAATAGSDTAQRMVQSTLGLEAFSPLRHRSIIEFFASVPVEERFDAGHRKGFLRRAGDRRLPAMLNWRSKDESIPRRMAQRMFSSPSVDSHLAEVRTCEVLRDTIDWAALRTSLGIARIGGIRPEAAERLLALFRFAAWANEVARRHGVA